MANFYCVLLALFFTLSNCYDFKLKQSDIDDINRRKATEIPLDLTFLENLDPIKWLPDFKFNLQKLNDAKIARGHVNLTDLYVNDFSDCTGLMSITFHTTPYGITPSFIFKFKNVSFSSKHFNKSQWYQLVKLKGNGDLKITFSDLEITVTIGINIMDGYDVPIDIIFKEVNINAPNKFTVTNLIEKEHDKIISKEFSDVIELFMKSDILFNLAQEKIKPIINAVLYAFNISPKTIKEALGIAF